MCERSDIDGVVDMADPFSLLPLCVHACATQSNVFATLQNVT